MKSNTLRKKNKIVTGKYLINRNFRDKKFLTKYNSKFIFEMNF